MSGQFMGETAIQIKERADDMEFGPERCIKCGNSRRLCKCMTEPDLKETSEDAETTSSTETGADTGGGVQGTESFNLAAGHTCDFEYIQNLIKRGYPFAASDAIDRQLQAATLENIDQILGWAQEAHALL